MAARRVKRKAWSTSLRRKSERKQGGYSVGTIAFYGPDNRHASKVAVGIAPEEGAKIDLLERWFKEDLDVRVDPRIGERVVAFLGSHGVRRVVVADGIVGCPHEEGIDYPEGEECPECPFWRSKDRWEHAVPE